MSKHTTRKALIIGIVAVCAFLGARSRAANAGSSVAYADGDGARACAGLVPCFNSIQDAVDHVGGPGSAQVMVFPDTYNESVDLNDMASSLDHVIGDIALTTVDSSGEASPGTATIHGPSPVSTSDQGFPASITIDGFVLQSTQEDGAFIVAGGSITIRHTAVDNPGNGSSIDGSGDDGFDLTTTDGGSITIEDSVAQGAHGDLGDGFEIAPDGDLTIRNTVASNNQGTEDNAGFYIPDAHGAVTFDNVTADNNTEYGIYLYTTGIVNLSTGETNNNGFRGTDLFTEFGVAAAGVSTQQGNDAVTIGNLTSSGNDDGGIQVQATGDVNVLDSRADDNDGAGLTLLSQDSVSVTNVESEDNVAQGLYIEGENQVNVSRVGAHHNGHGDTSEPGLEIVGFGAQLAAVSVHDSFVSRSAGQGIDLFNLGANGTHSITSNVICDNDDGGLRNNSTVLTLPAEGNWWGDATGPTSPHNPGGIGDAVNIGGDGSVDFDPWITHVEASQPSPGTARFQFGDAALSHLLENGPGDSIGQSPLTLTTDNGTVTAGSQTGQAISPAGSPIGQIKPFIVDGQILVTVLTANPGNANLALTGPCGLSANISIEPAPAGTSEIWGDWNCEGHVNLGDAIGIARFLVSLPLTPAPPADCPALGDSITIDGHAEHWGDLNCEGHVNLGDAIGIARFLVSLPLTPAPPATCPAIASTVVVSPGN